MNTSLCELQRRQWRLMNYVLLVEITPKTLLSRAVTLDSKYKIVHRGILYQILNMEFQVGTM